MNKRNFKNYQVAILKNSDKKKRKLEKQVDSGSSCTNNKAHEFVKQCKEISFQQTGVKCLQTFKKVGKPGKIIFNYF